MIIKKNKTIVIGAAILIFCLWCVSFLTPEWTIRRTILESLQPINSLKAEISTMGIVDAQYGYLYNVNGYMDRATGGELGFIYLKKLGPVWYVASKGTGP